MGYEMMNKLVKGADSHILSFFLDLLDKTKKDLIVLSGYRGANNGTHSLGEAIDIVSSNSDDLMYVFEFIKTNYSYDELFLIQNNSYPESIHYSSKKDIKKNRSLTNIQFTNNR